LQRGQIEPMSPLRVPIDHTDHVKGPPHARITLVEYGDYECPYCRGAQAVLVQLLTLFPADVRFVYRHFPLSEMHRHAVTAAEVAEAAATQGRFWDMHELLYARQQALALPHLLRQAAALGLDVDRLGREVEHHTHMPRIEADFTGGVRSGVHGTPTLFVDDLPYETPLELAGLAATIDQLLDAGPAVAPR
jgi:protein-disulfide isomerase